MRHPELIFLHSANADGFDVRPVTFKSCVRRQSAEPRRNGRCRLSRCEERDEPYGHVIEEIGVGQPGASKEPRARHFILEPIRASPYRPAAWSPPHRKA
jgi:hypothetical protein